MKTLIVLLIIIGIIYYLAQQSKKKNKTSLPSWVKDKDSYERWKAGRNTQIMQEGPTTSKDSAAFDLEAPRLIQIIQESIQIITKTKNPKTAMGRYDTIKQMSKRLFEILPQGKKINYEINGRPIRDINDLYIIAEEKAKWLEEQKVGGAKEETLKAAALSQWVKVFNKAIEDGHISEEELMELEALEERLVLTNDDTIIYWQNANLPVPVKNVPTPEDIKNILDIPKPAEWKLIVSFGKSSSQNFNQILSSIEIYPKYKYYKGPNEEDVHELTFDADDVLNFEQLWIRIKNWKSTIVKINDEIVDRNSISKWLICYRDKLKEKMTNPLFCFGASPYTFNLFGCHRIMLRDGIGAGGMCWYHMGKFDRKGIFHVDREAIATKIKQDIQTYKICPALDIEKIKRGLMLIPDTIDVRKDNGWTIEDYYTGIKRIVPIVHYKNLNEDSLKVSAGQFNVNIGVVVRMADYYSSISPQFKYILDVESKGKPS